MQEDRIAVLEKIAPVSVSRWGLVGAQQGQRTSVTPKMRSRAPEPGSMYSSISICWKTGNPRIGARRFFRQQKRLSPRPKAWGRVCAPKLSRSGSSAGGAGRAHVADDSVMTVVTKQERKDRRLSASGIQALAELLATQARVSSM